MRKSLLALAIAFISAQALAADARTVSVTGSCRRQAAPDRTSVVVSAEFRDADLRVASRKATEAYERARQAVQRLGLENLEMQTVEYSLQEIREWVKDRTVSKGYRARLGLKVATSNTQKLGEVIAIGAREGLAEAGSLTNYLSDERYAQEQFACLQDAAKNARAKAEKLASALGAKVGRTVKLTEQGQETGPPQPPVAFEAVSMKADARAAQPAPSIEAGVQTIATSVAATFELD